MKMKNIKYVTLLMILMLSMSCSDAFLDVNDSSEQPTSTTPQLTLPAAQVYTANFLHDNAGNNYTLLGGIYAGAISDSGDRVWYQPEQQFLITNDTYAVNIWDNTYTRALNSYDYVENFEGEGYDYYKAIAKIMKTFHFASLVDIYGDIIYSEAFGRGENTQPAYDNDKAVYDAIYDQLNVAINLIDNAGPETVLADADVMLGGDMDAWKKFANTLKLRMLLRQVNTGEDLTAKYNEVFNNGIGFITSPVTVNPGYLDETNKQSPFYQRYGNGPADGPATSDNLAIRGSEVYVNFLKSNNDPRLSRLFNSVNGDYFGVPQNTYETQYNTSSTSDLGPGLLISSEQDDIIMNVSEALFLQAEAAQRFGLGDPATLYRAAITASIDELGATDALSYETNSINPLINWNLAVANGKEIEAIITQKWIANAFIGGFEVWMDRVRTDFPSFVPLPPGAFLTTFPSNLLYPTSEIANNSANVPSQGASATTDRHTFWMQ